MLLFILSLLIILLFSLLFFSLSTLILLKFNCAISCFIKFSFLLILFSFDISIFSFWFSSSTSSSSSCIGWSFNTRRLGKASINFLASSPVSIFIFNFFKDVNSVSASIALSRSSKGFALMSKFINVDLYLFNSLGNSDSCLLL